MTSSDLRAWQKRMGYTYDTARKALGISEATYADMLAGRSRTSGKPITIDRRTELACFALEHCDPEQINPENNLPSDI